MRELAGLILLLACLAAAGGQRSSAARLEFIRKNPCPSTGERKGPCPGHVVDHVAPLCAGGPDKPENMQWQTRADSLAKDRDERRMCRDLKRQR